MNIIDKLTPKNQAEAIADFGIKKKSAVTLLVGYLTHRSVYGYFDKIDCEPKHRNSKERLRHRVFTKYLNNGVVRRHMAGVEKNYYTSARSGHAILNFDLDSHLPVPDIEACWRAARKIDQHIPNIYWEAVGRGVHGYIVVEYAPGMRARDMVEVFKHVQGFIVEVVGHEPGVTGVECKGQPSYYYHENGEQQINMGTLAQFPRNATFDDLTKCVYKAEDLLKLKIQKKASKRSAQACGSRCNFVGPQDLARLPDLKRLAEDVLRRHGEIRSSGTHRVTAADMANLFLVMDWASRNLDETRTMPTERIKEIYNQLKDDDKLLPGDDGVIRAWHHERFQAVRNFLADLGLIDVEDDEYWTEYVGPKGRMNGRACKWTICLETVVRFFENRQELNTHTSIPTHFISSFRPRRIFHDAAADFGRLLLWYDQFDWPDYESQAA